MNVKVAFFAGAREITGADFLELNLDQSATVADVQSALISQFPELERLIEQSAWSVDHEYVDNQHSLYHGAEVGMIPPVSGG